MTSFSFEIRNQDLKNLQ